MKLAFTAAVGSLCVLGGAAVAIDQDVLEGALLAAIGGLILTVRWLSILLDEAAGSR